jgi:hypothetical protein
MLAVETNGCFIMSLSSVLGVSLGADLERAELCSAECPGCLEEHTGFMHAKHSHC